ncbi:hypothetical protein Tco_0032431 [Tanacetum coccineum]
MSPGGFHYGQAVRDVTASWPEFTADHLIAHILNRRSSKSSVYHPLDKTCFSFGRIPLSMNIPSGRVIRIHYAFVQDELVYGLSVFSLTLPQDFTMAKVACIDNNSKGNPVSWGHFNLGDSEMSHRSGNFGKILNEPSVETGMTEKTSNTLNGGGMR